MQKIDLSVILKLFGVKVAPEHVAQIEAIIPQIPARLNQAIGVVNAAIESNAARLTAIERRQEMIETALVRLLEARSEHRLGIIDGHRDTA